jgi:hypothetical protein
METKYIVNNLSGQTINGNVTINGNLSVTGVTTGNLATYKALLTDIGSQTGTTLNDFGGFNGGFIIGETYTIVNYVSGDSFSNIANVTSGVIDTTGCIFIATGETPTNWNNGSTLVSSSNLVVTVLENNLGFDIEWIEDFMSPGIYAGFNSTTGPLYNTFNRNSTFLLGGNQTPIFGPNPIETFIFPNNFNEKDDSIILFVVDLSVPEPVDNSLYYYSIEIQILQDLDTTPTVISGTTTSFPFTNVSVEFYCGDMFIQSFYTSGGTIVNDISEVVTVLNTDTNTSFLGTFSDDGGNIILTMATNLETQFCANSTLTFYVFND